MTQLIRRARAIVVARIRAGTPVTEVAHGMGISRQTVYKWLRRAADARAAGGGPEALAALGDRSSRPHRSPQRLPRYRRRQILRRRRQRWSSRRIAQYYQRPVSTVVTEVRRLGLNRLDRLEPTRPVVLYEHGRPGELVHLDIEKLGRVGRVGQRVHADRRQRQRGIGWEYVHAAIDDHSRLAYAEVVPDEECATTVGFLMRAVAWYAARGIVVQRILTDHGGAHRSTAFAITAVELGVSQRFTQPYRPQTNGKAERFIRTLLTEWAYATAYGRSGRRTRALHPYLTFYNNERRNSALNDHPLTSRLLAVL